ncbi:MAG: hypothetical protein PHE55_06605 [Methylococcaceae bacterium]|nr:hypothetical protein [Methylococcaceae bacterium]
MIPFHLAQEGDAVLFHGSAVKMGSGAVSFLADSFGGKSTLANYLQEQGHPLITDDDLRIEGEGPFMAHPSIPFVRPYRRQEDLGNRVERFNSRSEPLRRIYILELSESSARVIPVSGVEVAAILLKQSRFRLTERAAERFRFCTRLASSIRVARLVVPRAIHRLPEVHEVLLTDLEEYS